MKGTKVLIVIPVYNEENILVKSITNLNKYLKNSEFPYKYTILIADNKSTDKTQELGKQLQKKIKEVKYKRIERKGRGYALKQVWGLAKEDILSYMDVDLSTDLKAFKPLIDSIAKHDAVLAIGSRLGKKSKVVGRSAYREFLSRAYNFTLKLVFKYNIKDAQCGFKAIKRKEYEKIAESLEDNNWFFDTELILLCKHFNYKTAQIGVTWIDDPDSRVKIVKTVREDLEGILRMKKKLKKTEKNDKTAR